MALKIMLIDDEPTSLSLLKSMIKTLGFEVKTFADSRLAAEELVRRKFDAIILDARMPYLDGFELTSRIRSSSSNCKVPIVMLTGFSDVETMRRGFSAGITLFLSKPITQQRIQHLAKALQGPALIEKRRYFRVSFRADITISTEIRDYKSVSLNLSQGGMLLESLHILAPGQRIGLDFNVPGHSAMLKLAATVVRQESPNLIAVRFLTLTPSELEVIQVYIMDAITADTGK
jgi:CheY-like chemotaxis protein